MNFTELKIHLMQQGAVFSDSARRIMKKGKFGRIQFSDYATTGGIVLKIGTQFYVNVPVRFEHTPFSVEAEENHFFLKMDSSVLPIDVKYIPVPKYALDNVLLEDGTPVRDMVMTHADRIRISPVHGCGFHCQFCTCNTQRYMNIPIEKLDAAFQVALNDAYNKPRHTLISGGTPEKTEESYAYINQVYRFFPLKYSHMEFDVMLSPRGLYSDKNSVEDYRDFLKYLRYDCNVETMSINLELYNEYYRKKYVPEKYEIGKDNYFSFIREAVRIFGDNKIRSSLIVGLEEKVDTLQAVQKLTDIGCIPVLSAFVPAVETFMARYPAPSTDFLLDVVNEAHKLAVQANMQLGPICKPCSHNSLTMEEGLFY